MCVAFEVADNCEIDASLPTSSVGVGAVDGDGGIEVSGVEVVSGGAVSAGVVADCTWQGQQWGVLAKAGSPLGALVTEAIVVGVVGEIGEELEFGCYV